jgi:hypothetical protein
MQETQIKYFTPQEARRTLPLVKRIVRDILLDVSRIRSIAQFSPDNFSGNDEVERLTTNIESYMKELDEIGCSYKDWNFEIGLVDFPSFINDEEVLLCWRSDEEDILFYHGVLEGYAGRKKIPAEYL